MSQFRFEDDNPILSGETLSKVRGVTLVVGCGSLIAATFMAPGTLYAVTVALGVLAFGVSYWSGRWCEEDLTAVICSYRKLESELRTKDKALKEAITTISALRKHIQELSAAQADLGGNDGPSTETADGTGDSDGHVNGDEPPTSVGRTPRGVPLRVVHPPDHGMAEGPA